MARLKDRYKAEILPKLQEEFGIKNSLAVPKLTKVVINIGVGDAKDNQGILDKVVENLTALSGQKPVVTKAKKSIATFKLGKGQPIGAMVTIRGDRMYDFVDKLINIVLPKMRDFRGLPNAFDKQGNYTLGLKEQAMFPEISFQSARSGEKVRGLEISLVTTSKNYDHGKRLFELLGLPLRKD